MTIDKRRAVGDQLFQDFFWHVVVIKIEPSSGDSVSGGKRMKLIEVVIANQMCPQPAVCRPTGRIDEYAHY